MQKNVIKKIILFIFIAITLLNISIPVFASSEPLIIDGVDCSDMRVNVDDELYLIMVRYVDEVTNKIIAEDYMRGIPPDTNYNIKPKDIPNYVCTKSNNSSGCATKPTIILIYKYKYIGKVTVKEVDDVTNQLLKTYDITNKEGTKITISPTKHDMYECVTDKINYTFDKKDDVVELRYRKLFEYNITYTDEESGNTLKNYKTLVKQGSEVTPEKLTFDNYIEDNEKNKDAYKPQIIKDKTNLVLYFYPEKMNISVDINLEKGEINGILQKMEGKASKVETTDRQNKINGNSKITYKITATNNSNKIASFKLTDIFPENYSMVAKNNTDWTIDDTKRSSFIIIENLGIGQSKTYEAVLEKNDSSTPIYQTVINGAKVEGDFKEIKTDDNSSSTNTIITPRTGARKVFLGGVLASLIIGLIILMKQKKRLLLKEYKTSKKSKN